MCADLAEATSAGRPSVRQRVFLHLEPRAWPRKGLSATNKIVCSLIVASSLIAILETEAAIVSGNEGLFWTLEAIFYAVFAVEYALRVWASSEDQRFGPGPAGRLRYMASPAALLDLAALLPAMTMFGGSDAFLLRLFRLLRILRLARLGRFSDAMTQIAGAVRARRYELTLSLGIAVLLLVVSSTLLYLVEADVQPDAFGSIPRAMWWSVATLTTVGYGDVFPVTAVGRLLAAATAVTGIGLIAMPAGILAAAFSDAIQQRRNETSE